MTVEELLVSLAERRITLTVEGDQIHYSGPTGALTPELREAISDRRSEIIARLTPRHNGTSRREETCVHLHPQFWIDAPLLNGRIWTTCRLCGRFIGYRPSEN